MELKGKGFVGVNWIHLAQDGEIRQALTSSIMNLRIPLKAHTLLTSYATISF
jgi:hypothetical protein